MSVPPPTSAPPATAPELVLALEAPRGWRRPRTSGTDRLRLHAAGVSLEHGRVLFAPLELPLGAVKIATVDPGPARAGADMGRFPVLRSLGPGNGDPAQRGDRGLAVDRQRRQRARHPGRGGRGAERRAAVRQAARRTGLRACFDADFVTALAARSPLGNPTLHGVLFRVASALDAERAFRRWGFQSVLTDKDVPPTLRRHLPTDVPADPIVPGDRRRRRRGDVDRAARHGLTRPSRYGERP